MKCQIHFYITFIQLISPPTSICNKCLLYLVHNVTWNIERKHIEESIPLDYLSYQGIFSPHFFKKRPMPTYKLKP